MFKFWNARSTAQILLACGLLSGASVGTAQAANVAPVITGNPSTSVAPGAAYSFRPTASDANRDRLRFTLSNRPSWMGINSSTGQIYGIAPRSYAGRTYSNLVLSVSDGRIRVALPAFSITISATTANRAPSVSGSPSTSATEGSTYSFQPTGSDPDGQSLTWSIANKPSWAVFSSTSGQLSGTPSGTGVGTTSNIVITASDGSLSASLAPFSISVNAAVNREPTISGAPATSVVAGNVYTFTPAASDPDGNTLGFSIAGKPSWGTFSVASGTLAGTPTTAQAGTYSNIVISVNDGTVSKSLPAFTINVMQPAPSGTASLSWTAPTQNTDGTVLTDLAGYRVYHGTSATALNEVVLVPGSTTVSYTFNQLTRGSHYFAVAAYNTAGTESAMSAVGSKTIP
jgi:hypothetical protein